MIYRRNEGLFSNINVFQRMICHDFLHYKEQDNYIELYLEEYDKDINFYPHLFNLDKNISINNEACNALLSCATKEFGLFEEFVDIKSIDLVRRKYLNYSLEVMAKAKDILNFIPEKYTFVWYRGTDKKSEAHIIDIKKVVDVALSKNLPLVVKTDEIKFKKYLQENSIKHTMLEAMPINENGYCLHKNLYLISGQDFYKRNGITKIEYLQKMMAITIVAERSSFFVCTPSNISSWVIQNRGHFKNQAIFKDNNSFLYE